MYIILWSGLGFGWEGEYWFGEDIGVFEMQDSEDVRQKILGISYTDWGEYWSFYENLHYVKKNAKDDKPFTLNAHVRDN